MTRVFLLMGIVSGMAFNCNSSVNHYNLYLHFVSTVTKNHIAMTWCHYIFQSGQAFEQWISSQPIYSLGHLPAAVSAFDHHPAYQLASILYRENWGLSCELHFWTACCKSISLFQHPSWIPALGRRQVCCSLVFNTSSPFTTSWFLCSNSPSFFSSLQLILA